MRETWRGTWRMMVFLSLIALLAPLQMLFRTQSLPLLFHKIMVRVLSIKIIQQGSFAPCLRVSNHLSWLDIVVLGSLGKMSFIAKSDVAQWPLFGLLAKLQRTIFVERDNRQKVVESLRVIKARLNASPLMLFGEGTTSDGSCVLPFLSSLIVTPVQPIVIYYEEVERIAWHGEMTLLPHFWAIFKRPQTKVKVICLAVIQEGARKHVARTLERQVRETYEKCLNTDKNGFGAA
jgi:lyso-ornithine lipid O-acyltransferase